MINKSLLKGMFLSTVFISSGAFAAVQSIVASPSGFSDIVVGDTVQFTVSYPASNPAGATGLGLKIYFDSTKLTLTGTSDVFTTNKLAESVGADSSNGDGDASTDQFINIAWVNFGGEWPARGENLVTATFTASTGFTADTTINFTGDPAAGNTFSADPIPVALKVVTPPDNIPPTVTAPADITKEATGASTAVALGAATVTDNVDSELTATPAPAGPYAVGVHTITWTATDAAGNTGTNTQKVTITDTTPPVVAPPANKTVTATGTNTPVSLGTATATDLVDGSVTVTPSTTGPFPLGATTITWSATDAHGNTGTATQIVTVTEAPIDDTAPVVTPPADITKEATGPQTAVNLGTATAIDNVDGALTPIPLDSGPYPIGTTPVTWEAVDSSNNKGTAIQNVTITDTTGPTISVPANITIQLQKGETEATVDYGNATATDLVDGSVATSVLSGGDIGTFPIGINTIIWTATDSRGNVSTAPQLITIRAFAAAIPTLSEWGIILLSLMLALVSWSGLGRSRKIS